MRVTVVIDDRRVRGRVSEHGRHVILPEACACGEAECVVGGTGITHHDHDTYYGGARTLCCGAECAIETRVDTIFGIDEDQAVLEHGRPRVYR